MAAVPTFDAMTVSCLISVLLPCSLTSSIRYQDFIIFHHWRADGIKAKRAGRTGCNSGRSLRSGAGRAFSYRRVMLLDCHDQRFMLLTAPIDTAQPREGRWGGDKHLHRSLRRLTRLRQLWRAVSWRNPVGPFYWVQSPLLACQFDVDEVSAHRGHLHALVRCPAMLTPHGLICRPHRARHFTRHWPQTYLACPWLPPKPQPRSTALSVH